MKQVLNAFILALLSLVPDTLKAGETIVVFKLPEVNDLSFNPGQIRFGVPVGGKYYNRDFRAEGMVDNATTINIMVHLHEAKAITLFQVARSHHFSKTDYFLLNLKHEHFSFRSIGI